MRFWSGSLQYTDNSGPIAPVRRTGPSRISTPFAPRCVLSGLCPEILDLALRTTQHPIYEKSVSVGRHLGRDPRGKPHQRGRKRLAQSEHPLEARQGNLDALPHSAAPLGALGSKNDAHFGQGFPQLLAPVGQVCQEPPRYPLPQSRLGEELLGQGDVRDVLKGVSS
jgi:hypothetical protein